MIFVTADKVKLTIFSLRSRKFSGIDVFPTLIFHFSFAVVSLWNWLAQSRKNASVFSMQ